MEKSSWAIVPEIDRRRNNRHQRSHFTFELAAISCMSSYVPLPSAPVIALCCTMLLRKKPGPVVLPPCELHLLRWSNTLISDARKNSRVLARVPRKGPSRNSRVWEREFHLYSNCVEINEEQTLLCWGRVIEVEREWKCEKNVGKVKI